MINDEEPIFEQVNEKPSLPSGSNF